MPRRRCSPGDFADEIEAHLESESQGLQEEGRNVEQARAGARRRFGNGTHVLERLYGVDRSR